MSCRPRPRKLDRDLRRPKAHDRTIQPQAPVVKPYLLTGLTYLECLPELSVRVHALSLVPADPVVNVVIDVTCECPPGGLMDRYPH